MVSFSFHAPTRVLFGEGVRHQLAEAVSGTRWGLLSSPSVRSESGIAAVIDSCARGATHLSDLGNISPNPRLTEVERGLEIARKQQVQTIVAVGGGSVIDAAKLLRIALQHGSSAREALDQLDQVIRKAAAAAIQLIAVPTTAGTGTEVSRGAIITDDSTGAKLAARSERLVPDLAVIDPELTYSLSPHRTAETGFDIIAHAAETYLSRAATPMTDILARAALADVPGALLVALRDGGDVSARRTLALHAWLMGYNLAHSSTCLPHRMQYPVGAATDSSHQAGLAAIYPAWLKRMAGTGGSRLSVIGDSLGAALGMPPGGTVSAHVAMTRYLERLGLRIGLGDLGLSAEDVEGLSQAVTGRIDLDPLSPDRNLIADIYRESIST
jgi:alcohol dehydrogenase class IV